MRQNQFQMRVNWGDTDKAGIVFYPNYFKWFDIAGHQFFRSIGLPHTQLEREHVVLPLLDVRCTFENPLYYDDIITIKTQVVEVNHKTIKLAHEVYREEIRTGYGYELRGWVESIEGRMRAVAIPEQIKELLLSTNSLPQSTGNPWLSA